MMSNDDKKIFKLVNNKEKPPEETPGADATSLLKEAVDQFDTIILVGWKEDQFKISWCKEYTPDEVYVLLDLAKSRILNKLYEFD